MEFKEILKKRIPFLALIVIVTSLFLLVLVDISIHYYRWSTDWYGSNHHDHWGIRLDSGFFLYLPMTIPFLILSVLVYPFAVWSHIENNPESVSHSRKWFVLGGLVIPSIFGYNVSFVDVYQYSNIGPLYTPIIAPLYAFDFNTFSLGTGVVFPLFVSYQIFSLGLLTLVLGLWMVLNLYLFEGRFIGYRVFLIPILLSMIFSISIIVSSFFSTLMFSNSVPSVYMSVPSFALGMLIMGQNQRNQA